MEFDFLLKENDFFWMLIVLSFYLIPLSIGLLIAFIKEVLDFLFNNNEVTQLINRADRYSHENFQDEMDALNLKIKILKNRLMEEESEEIRAYWNREWNLDKAKEEIQRAQKFRQLFNPSE